MNEFVRYLALAAVVSITLHACIRNLLVAALLSSVVCAVLNIISETVRNALQHPDTFGIGGDDLVFWGPMLFLMGAVPAFLVALITGLPFAIIRNRRHRH